MVLYHKVACRFSNLLPKIDVFLLSPFHSVIMAENTRQYGVTPAISSTLPTPAELRLNEALLAELRSQNNFEAAEDTEKRKKVLAHLQNVAEEFVRQIGKMKGLNSSVIDSAGGKVSTFGSYRLGVYGPGMFSITSVCACPNMVIRL